MENNGKSTLPKDRRLAFRVPVDLVETYESVRRSLVDLGKIDGSPTQLFVYLIKAAQEDLERNKKVLALEIAAKKYEVAKSVLEAALRDAGVEPPPPELPKQGPGPGGKP